MSAMENTKKKCEDYKPCNIKDNDGYCMNNDRSCIWREGAVDTSEGQLIIPAVSNLLCGYFEPDNSTSSATKCKCGREKWEHPKAT